MSRAKRCKLCRKKRTRLNGIETTLGWLCYRCVRKFRRETRALDEKFDRTASAEQSEVA